MKENEIKFFNSIHSHPPLLNTYFPFPNVRFREIIKFTKMEKYKQEEIEKSLNTIKNSSLDEKLKEEKVIQIYSNPGKAIFF